MLHKDASVDNIHVIANWVVVDDTARDALTVAAADVGKVCWVTTGNHFYVLVDDSPMDWYELGGGAAGAWQPPLFSAYRGTSVQAISATTDTKVQFNTEEADTDNLFDAVTNYRFTPNIAGWYHLTARVLASSALASNSVISIWKNGAVAKAGMQDNASHYALQVDAYVYFNGSTDYAEIYVYLSAGVNISVGASASYFQGVLVRPD